MVGEGDAAEDGGGFSCMFDGTTLISAAEQTHTMSTQMEGVLKKGDHHAAEDLFQQLTAASKKP
jgi:hypothetical protein